MSDIDPLSPHGWHSNFPEFEKESPRVIRARLSDFIPDASPQQERAWDDSIPKLQTEVREVVSGEPDADRYTAILEYQLPMESRRADVVLLVRGAIVVLELKGKIESAAQQEMTDAQRQYFLRQQLKAIQDELGEGEKPEAQDLRKRIAEATLPEAGLGSSEGEPTHDGAGEDAGSER